MKALTLAAAVALPALAGGDIALAQNVPDTTQVQQTILDATRAQIDAQERQRTVYRSEWHGYVCFPVNETDVDSSYMSNALFIAKMDSLIANHPARIDSIAVLATASPEGKDYYNDYLSRNRSRSLKKFIQKRYPELNAVPVRTVAYTSDWSYLLPEIGLDGNLPRKDEVLSILRSSRTDEVKSWLLKKLDDGKTFGYIRDKYLSDIRTGTVCVYFEDSDVRPQFESYHRVDTLYIKEEHFYKDTTDIRAAVEAVLAAKALENSPKAIAEKKKAKHRETVEARFAEDRYPVFAFRTNLLLPLTNIGVEVPVGNRFSIGADFYSPWIPRDLFPDVKRREWCFQLQTASLEGRYWFGKKHSNNVADNRRYRLSGHSIGLMAMAGYYDLGMNWKGVQGEFLAVGLDYMYSAALGRRGGVHLEFELGVGYVMSPGARTYEVYVEGGKLFEAPSVTRDINFIGPVRASVSLVVPIFKRMDRGNN